MLISPALAAHFVPPSKGTGGGTALAIILAVGITLFLLNMVWKKRRKRLLERDDNDNGE